MKLNKEIIILLVIALVCGIGYFMLINRATSKENKQTTTHQVDLRGASIGELDLSNKPEQPSEESSLDISVSVGGAYMTRTDEKVLGALVTIKF